MGSFNQIEQRIRNRHASHFENRMDSLAEDINETVMAGSDHDLLETREVVENLVENHWRTLRDVIHATLVTQNWPELQRSIKQLVDDQVKRELNAEGMDQAMAKHLHEDMINEIEGAADAHMDFMREQG